LQCRGALDSLVDVAAGGLAIAHLCCVLVNEFVLISAGQAVADPFTTPQFHDLLDGALRAPRP
jgi:hypothetical protein